MKNAMIDISHLHRAIVSAGHHTATKLQAPCTFQGGLSKHPLHCCVYVTVQNYRTPCTVPTSGANYTRHCWYTDCQNRSYLFVQEAAQGFMLLSREQTRSRRVRRR